MTMFQAGLAVAMVLIGGIAALLGGVVLVSALSNSAISISQGGGAVETITQAADPGRFMKLTLLLGVAPLILGAAGAWWGVRTLRR